MNLHAKNIGSNSIEAVLKQSHSIVITIDGSAGVGKTTAAKLLSGSLQFCLLDSGAIYRALALHLIRNGVLPNSEPVPESVLDSLDLRIDFDVGSMSLCLGDEDVTQFIRQERIGITASQFSAKPEVRRALLDLQRSAASKWNLVAEGRDMGSVVFPNANVKFFLMASIEERSKRRYLELVQKGEAARLSLVKQQIQSRDQRDESRREAPLVRPIDAIAIDSSHMDIHAVVACMIGYVTERINL